MILCAYCHERQADSLDHVVPKTLYRKGRRVLPDELKGTVAACHQCNIRKGTRKLVPASWADKIPALKEAIPGHWRSWNGDPKAPNYTAVFK